ncbi:uncharacterized protein UDID_18728 [Ustilago sp. UG-2017a]|nr:uncharacterized protein UDID_18728 [Ustilago sp. UG-2017a]
MRPVCPNVEYGIPSTDLHCRSTIRLRDPLDSPKPQLRLAVSSRSTGRYEKEVKAKGARNFRFNRSPPGRNMRRIEAVHCDRLLQPDIREALQGRVHVRSYAFLRLHLESTSNKAFRSRSRMVADPQSLPTSIQPDIHFYRPLITHPDPVGGL